MRAREWMWDKPKKKKYQENKKSKAEIDAVGFVLFSCRNWPFLHCKPIVLALFVLLLCFLRATNSFYMATTFSISVVNVKETILCSFSGYFIFWKRNHKNIRVCGLFCIETELEWQWNKHQLFVAARFLFSSQTITSKKVRFTSFYLFWRMGYESHHAIYGFLRYETVF